MIIEKIIIKSFGAIEDMTLEFSERVNVIEGQNEAGKSTIAAFIRYMLYGFEDCPDKEETSERERCLSWHTGIASGSMYVRVGGKRYLVNRTTTPGEVGAHATYREEASIIDLETGSPAFGKLSAGEVFLGVPRELFDNTAFIGQIGDSAINGGSVKASIENILFSGNERVNNQRAMAKISDKMESLLHKSGAGGAIYDLMTREAELEAALKSADEDNKEILKKEAELHTMRARRAEAEDKVDKLYELDGCYRNVMLIQTFDQLHTLEEESEAKAEAYNEFIAVNTKEGFVPDENYLAELKQARRGVNEAYDALKDARDAYTREKCAVGITKEIEGAIVDSDKMGGECEVLSRAGAIFKGRVRNIALSVLGVLMLIASAVLIAVSAAGTLDGMCIAIGAVAAALSLALAVTMLVLTLKSTKKLKELAAAFGTESYSDLVGKMGVISEARARRDAMLAAIEAARLGHDSAETRYGNAKRILAELILRWGEEPPVSELSDFLDRLEDKVEKFLNRKKELLDDKMTSEITVREIRRQLADKSEIDIRAQVSPLKRKALAGINHDEIINGIAAARAEIAEQDRLAYSVENELSILKGRSGDPGDYYSKISAIAERRRELQDKHKAYYIAYKAIEGATDSLRAEISPRLGEYATRMMEIMTDKKYSAFDVSDGLNVSFEAPDGRERSVDFLSGGTRDLAYVAVRAALIDMLYKEKPPICFDESFAHQDNLRAKAMMRAIGTLADEGCQSFVFTCRAREGALASEMISGAGIFKLSVLED